PGGCYYHELAFTRMNISIKKDITMMVMTQVQARAMFPDCNAVYIAVGIVCVRPGILPATMSVAPNSPIARAKLNNAPVTSAVVDRGRVTFMNVCSLFAPSTFAAFSISASTFKKPAFADWYISGNATTVLAMTTAYHVNMMVAPKRVSYRSPMKPLFPNINLSRKPTTVGGTTRGSSKSVSIMPLPLNSALAMKRAAAVARTNTIRRASIATWSDNSTGAMNCSVVKLLNNKTIIFKYL